MAKIKNKKLQRKNKASKVKKYEDIKRLSQRAQLNYVLITQEFQSFIQFFNDIKPMLFEESPLYERLVAREKELEKAAIRELNLVFGMNVTEGTLADTPIYDMDEKLRESLDSIYMECLNTDMPNLDAKYLGYLAKSRMCDEILYPSISPSHIVLSFVKSANYHEQFVAFLATQEAGYEAKPDDVTSDDIQVMLVTLCELALTPKNKLPDLITLTLASAGAEKPKFNSELANLLLQNLPDFK